MKNIIQFYRLLSFFAVAICISSLANAQRGYRNNTHSQRSGHSSAYRGDYNYRSYRSPVIFAQPYHSYARYRSVPYGSISITFGGNPYYYSGGRYYRPYGGYYRSVFPPVGIRIGVLPLGYVPIFVGPNQYYFHGGTYYQRYDDRNYEVVDAPMGAQISSLPSGAKSVEINGEKMYELNGTYYKEDRNFKGQVVYTVVGKNGKIDNTGDAPPADAPVIGDRVAQIPADSKTIMLNGQKLYVSPDDTYYQLDQDGSYTVVGSASPASL